jgi:hypothetical protein
MLGSKLSNTEDITHKITLTRHAFSLHWRTWLSKKHIPLCTRVRLYNACIKPILTYNISCLGAPHSAMKLLSSLHRTQLRMLMGIHYPKIITNTYLHKCTRTQNILIDIARLRWSMFGHILRSSPKTPAHRMTLSYFTPRHHKEHRAYHGRRPTSLPTTLHEDLTRIGHRLTNTRHFFTLKRTAIDRKAWKRFTNTIVKAYADHLDTIEPPSHKTIFTHTPLPRPSWSVLLVPPQPPHQPQPTEEPENGGTSAAVEAAQTPVPEARNTQQTNNPIRLTLYHPLIIRINTRTQSVVTHTASSSSANQSRQGGRPNPLPSNRRNNDTTEEGSRRNTTRKRGRLHDGDQHNDTEEARQQDARNVRSRRSAEGPYEDADEDRMWLDRA